MRNRDPVTAVRDHSGSSVEPGAEMRRIRDEIRRRMSAGTSRGVDVFEDGLRHVRATWNVGPLSFESSVPIIGPLIAAVRTAWNSVATKWQVRHILLQQNEYNLSVYRLLQDMCHQLLQTDAALGQMHERLEDLELQLITTRNLLSDAISPSVSQRPDGGAPPSVDTPRPGEQAD